METELAIKESGQGDWVGQLLKHRDSLIQDLGDQMLYGAAVQEIRKLLYAHDVPTAAFIDDHVANAIVQRNRLLKALTLIALKELKPGRAMQIAQKALETYNDKEWNISLLEEQESGS